MNSDVKQAYLKAFSRNADESRECGFDWLCAICGAGIADDSDLHDEMAHKLHATLKEEER